MRHQPCNINENSDDDDEVVIVDGEQQPEAMDVVQQPSEQPIWSGGVEPTAYEDEDNEPGERKRPKSCEAIE